MKRSDLTVLNLLKNLGSTRWDILSGVLLSSLLEIQIVFLSEHQGALDIERELCGGLYSQLDFIVHSEAAVLGFVSNHVGDFRLVLIVARSLPLLISLEAAIQLKWLLEITNDFKFILEWYGLLYSVVILELQVVVDVDLLDVD